MNQTEKLASAAFLIKKAEMDSTGLGASIGAGAGGALGAGAGAALTLLLSRLGGGGMAFKLNKLNRIKNIKLRNTLIQKAHDQFRRENNKALGVGAVGGGVLGGGLGAGVGAGAGKLIELISGAAEE